MSPFSVPLMYILLSLTTWYPNNQVEGLSLRKTCSTSLSSHYFLSLHLRMGLVRLPPSMLAYQLVSFLGSWLGSHIVQISQVQLSCHITKSWSHSKHPVLLLLKSVTSSSMTFSVSEAWGCVVDKKNPHHLKSPLTIIFVVCLQSTAELAPGLLVSYPSLDSFERTCQLLSIFNLFLDSFLWSSINQ